MSRSNHQLAFFAVAFAVASMALRAQQDPPAPTFSNVTVHDPSVVRAGGAYYVFGSHMASASTTDWLHWTQISTSAAYPNPLIRNQNPQTEFSEALTWAQTTTFWAPDVIKLADNRYYYYYCACRGDSPLSALGLAVSDSITGPYSNVGLLLKSGMSGLSPDGTVYNNAVHPNVVDPSVFFDQTGKLWMVYGSYSGGIFILSLDPATGQPVAGQAYGKKLIGGNNSTIEGPYIIYSPETAYYYLFFTFGGLDANGGYNIRVGRSRNPDGPYLDAAGNDLTNVKGAPGTYFDNASIAPYGAKLMGNYQFLHVAGEPQTTSRGYVSPGGVSVNHDAATGRYFLVFHTRFVGRGEQHEVRVHQMFFNADGWPVVAPQRYAQETLATADAAQIPGDFKLINHGKDITATVKTSSVITLNADRSITGATTGTWQLTGDHDATLTLGGVVYRGVFVRLWDDDNQVWTQTFTALSSDGVSAWGSKVTSAVVATAPAFTMQPVSQSVTPGTAATFTVAASGTPVPTFQWKKDGNSIAGATNATYSIASVTNADAGSYTAVATNSAGSVTSNAATLTVTVANAAPVFTTQPISQNGNVGGTITFTAIASGIPAPTFQWAKDGVNLGGATNPTLTLINLQAGDAGAYRVTATNSAGSVASNAAVLTVGSLPIITTQPLSSAVFVGGSVSFAAAASGTPAPTFRWQKDGIDIAGATAATLTLNNIQLGDAGSYALVATNTGGSSTSRFARLVVLVAQPNAITYDPTSFPTGVTAGGTASFDYLLTNIGTRNWGVNHYVSMRDSNGTFVAFTPLIGVNSGESKTAHLSFPAPATPGPHTYLVQALESGVEFFSTQVTLTLTVLAARTNSTTYNQTNFPIKATPGSDLIFNYNVTNTGTQAWGTNHFLSLRNNADVYAGFSSLNGVASGQSKTVNLSFKAPSTPGVYLYQVQALESGNEFFQNQDNLTIKVVAPQPNAIAYTPTRSTDNIVPAATVNLRYSLNNTGTGTWGSEHYLSLRDNNGTYLSFVSLSGVAPAATITASFSFVAPSVPGAYSYYVQALENGVEFFDTQDLVTLTVLPTPVGNAATYNATTFPVSVAPGATVNFSSNLTNRGTKTWGANHYLSLRDADNIFLQFLPLTGTAPNSSKTLNFNFTAPTTPGIYTYHVQGFESGVEFFNMSDDLVLIVK